MIKINISKKDKEKIENMIWGDAQSAKTGLINNLQKVGLKESEFPMLYKLLYYKNAGEFKINEDAVKKLLLGDREYLEEVICYVGIIKDEKAKWLLKYIFKYDAFSKRPITNDFLRILKLEVCPYCNRQYIITTSSRKVRAQLDHYYPKDKYPYLALSLYNMIPCCATCNTAKSDLDTYVTPILYPYEEEFGYNVNFKIKSKDKNYVKLIQGLSNSFDIEIEREKGTDEQVCTQIERLHLNELYNEHKAYVNDILKSKYINTEERIKEIQKSFPQLFESKDDVKNIMFMSDINKERWGKRPLSKLTHDIDKYTLL